MVMWTNSQEGENFPLKHIPSTFGIIDNKPSLDAAAYIKNSEFVNFKQQWEAEHLSSCKSGAVFIRHEKAEDQTAGHFLTKVKCSNCDRSSLIYFKDPSDENLGWAGGCGNIHCTGPENMLVMDHTGDFFGSVIEDAQGKPSASISNNESIGDNLEDCKLVEEWNAYWCKTDKMAVFEFESRASDK